MTLSNRLQAGEVLQAPGVFDALSARLAERAGFPLAFLSGSAMGFSQLGRPDVGLLSLTEVALCLDRICDRVDIPIVVDVDSGFGNSLAVARTVRTLERAGASGLQLEDQLNTKPASEVTKRPLVAPGVMVDKIKAALDARQSDATLLSARSDAAYTEGLSAAIDRGAAYLDAGADLLFIEGLSDVAALQKVCSRFADALPLVYNTECAKQTPDAERLESLGYRVLLFPGVIVRAMTAGGDTAAIELARELGLGSEQPASLAEILQFEEFLRPRN